MCAYCHQIIAPNLNLLHISGFSRFVVTGGAPVPIICGHNTGQHMYIGEETPLRNTESVFRDELNKKMLSVLPDCQKLQHFHEGLLY